MPTSLLLAAFVSAPAWALGPCPTVDFDLGSAVGQNVANGDTCPAGNDFSGATCAGSQGSPDVAYRWVAPATGPYTFTTEGASSYDTALTVRDWATCGTQQIGCDDDAGTGLLSSITLNLTVGDELIVVVDGFGSGSCGAYQLNIEGCAAGAVDSDGDGTCDGLDLCFGIDATGDSDTDGVCDSDDPCFGDHVTFPDTDGDLVCEDLDLCLGDDATGDPDGNGICTDREVRLEVGSVTPGSTLVLSVVNLPPGTTVFFAATLSGTGAGPCLPTLGFCSSLLQPFLIGQSRADAFGDAVLSARVPALPAGTEVWFQGYAVTGGAATVSSVARRIVP